MWWMFLYVLAIYSSFKKVKNVKFVEEENKLNSFISSFLFFISLLILLLFFILNLLLIFSFQRLNSFSVFPSFLPPCTFFVSFFLFFLCFHLSFLSWFLLLFLSSLVAVALRNQKVTISKDNGQITKVANSVSIPTLSHLTLCFELERSNQKQVHRRRTPRQ